MHRAIWRSFWTVKKVKCTLVQALRLCTGRTAHGGSRGLALLFLYHVTRRGWGVSVTPRPLFTPRKDPVPIVEEAGWAPVPVWTGAENFAPTGFRSPDSPVRSELLYRLRYPAHIFWSSPDESNVNTIWRFLYHVIRIDVFPQYCNSVTFANIPNQVIQLKTDVLRLWYCLTHNFLVILYKK